MSLSRRAFLAIGSSGAVLYALGPVELLKPAQALENKPMLPWQTTSRLRFLNAAGRHIGPAFDITSDMWSFKELPDGRIGAFMKHDLVLHGWEGDDGLVCKMRLYSDCLFGNKIDFQLDRDQVGLDWAEILKPGTGKTLILTWGKSPMVAID